MRGQRKSPRGIKGLVSESQDDSTERSATSTSLATSHTSSLRSKASSECSWDGSTNVSKSARDKRERKTAPSPAPSNFFGKGKSGWQNEGLSVDHGSSQADDNIRDWIPLSTMSSEVEERSAGPTSSVASSHIQIRQIPSYDSAQMSVSESMVPIAPMVLGSGSRQRATDISRVVPFAFYPTGPPVPLAMLLVYKFDTDMGIS
ncbi:hypothetical protein AQUCO_00700018v1 [Aquilegia coerulea]|uniref:Uncharacterized protein n=1 Tax=Aquilegia coerulea TaxID=218851 RepID=A0A2G5EI66_AQUCA|nr:hypothetical protein AQUCO_00700018v1 [Aquilegia coerulea]